MKILNYSGKNPKNLALHTPLEIYSHYIYSILSFHSVGWECLCKLYLRPVPNKFQEFMSRVGAGDKWKYLDIFAG